MCHIWTKITTQGDVWWDERNLMNLKNPKPINPMVIRKSTKLQLGVEVYFVFSSCIQLRIFLMFFANLPVSMEISSHFWRRHYYMPKHKVYINLLDYLLFLWNQTTICIHTHTHTTSVRLVCAFFNLNIHSRRLKIIFYQHNCTGWQGALYNV